MTLIGAGAIVLDGRVCRPGWLETSGGRILACGPGAAPPRADHEFADSVVVPGFIDMHVHGGAGASYIDGVSAAVARAAGFRGTGRRGQMTATTPARALGLSEVGSLRPGLSADLVVLNQDLQPSAIMAGGEWQATH